MSIRNSQLINATLVFIFLSSVSIYCQVFTRELNSIPFSDNAGIYKNIFSGGFNNFEMQFVDIDGDGDYDLFYLDSDKTFGWFKNTGSQTLPNFELSLNSIPGLNIHDWYFFVDIDNDNDFDLFTASTSNLIEFRRNTGNTANPIFNLEIDTLKESNGNPIFSEFGSNPYFVDIDNDGDYDFITGNSLGTLTFYENAGSSTNFRFNFITNKWQNIVIIGGGFSNQNLHGASSIDFNDIDNDGDLDLFWGDFFSRSLYFIENFGTASTPDMQLLYNRYPQNEDSVWTSGFNMPRLVDIDGDGDLDMFVSVLYDPTVPQTLMYYKNNGSASTPDLRLVTDNYLRTLDVGDKSTPVFVDIDSDGDLDLLMGSERNPDGSLFYFKNIGTSTFPSYQLMDSTFDGIHGELSIAPALGDLDGDGDYDLLIGNFDGTVSYFVNDGNKFTPNFTFITKVKMQGDTLIDAGIYARPFLIDVEGDNDLDLILGGFNGKIQLYRNTGNSSPPVFTKDNSYFNSFDIGDDSSPFLIDIDGDGDLDLFTGNSTGAILFYKNTGNNVQPIWNLITNHYLGQSFGAYSTPVFSDIDGDADYDLFIGNIRGGLYFFRYSSTSNVNQERYSQQDNFRLNIYPNPFNPTLNINVYVSKLEIYKILVYNILGQKVKEIYSGLIKSGVKKLTWDGTNESGNQLNSGIYFINITGNNVSKTEKTILIK